MKKDVKNYVKMLIEASNQERCQELLEQHRSVKLQDRNHEVIQMLDDRIQFCKLEELYQAGQLVIRRGSQEDVIRHGALVEKLVDEWGSHEAMTEAWQRHLEIRREVRDLEICREVRDLEETQAQPFSAWKVTRFPADMMGRKCSDVPSYSYVETCQTEQEEERFLESVSDGESAIELEKIK